VLPLLELRFQGAGKPALTEKGDGWELADSSAVGESLRLPSRVTCAQREMPVLARRGHEAACWLNSVFGGWRGTQQCGHSGGRADSQCPDRSELALASSDLFDAVCAQPLPVYQEAWMAGRAHLVPRSRSAQGLPRHASKETGGASKPRALAARCPCCRAAKAGPPFGVTPQELAWPMAPGWFSSQTSGRRPGSVAQRP